MEGRPDQRSPDSAEPTARQRYSPDRGRRSSPRSGLPLDGGLAQDRGQRIEDDAHLAALVAEKRHAHELRGRDRLRYACPQADAFLDALAVRGHPLASETTRLL